MAKKIEAKLTLGDFGLATDHQVRTFKDYRDYWLRTYAEPHCKYSTYMGYESVFRTHLAVFDAKPLHEITRQDISELIARKLGEAKKSRGTVRNILAPLREMFNHAVDEGILKVNPASRLGRFVKHTSGKANRMKIDPLTREEVPILLEASKKYGYDTYALNLCAVRTGMRMGELFGLQWPDFDFNSRFVQVQRSWVRSREETPKSHQLRRIDMSKQLAEGLQELHRRRKVLFFTVRIEAEQLRSAGEYEDKIRSLLGLKHGCPRSSSEPSFDSTARCRHGSSLMKRAGNSSTTISDGASSSRCSRRPGCGGSVFMTCATRSRRCCSNKGSPRST